MKQEEDEWGQDSNCLNITSSMESGEEMGHVCLCPWNPKPSARLRHGNFLGSPLSGGMGED